MFGLTPDDVRDQFEISVWPENEPAVDLYMAMRTQWRVSFVGGTGLDYTALPAVMDLIGIEKDRRAGLFMDIRVMEATELIEVMRQYHRSLSK